MARQNKDPDFDAGEFFSREGASFDWQRYYHLLRRKWWLIALVTCVVCLGAFGWLLRQPKVFASRGVLQVDQQEQNLLNTVEIKSEKLDSLEYMNTVSQAMTSTTLMARVVGRLGLAKDPQFAPPKADKRGYTVTDLASKLQGQIAVSIRRGTRLIDIVAYDENPERAQQIAESTIKEFFRQNIEQRLSVSNVANEFLREESEKLKGKLEESERKLQAYKEQHKAVSLEESQNITVDKLKELNSEVTQAKATRLRLESDLEQIKKMPADNIETMLQISSVSAIPQVASIREQLIKAESAYAATKQRYLYKHPKNIAVATQIAQLKESLKETLKNASDILLTQYKAAEDTEAKLMRALEDQERSALDLNKIAIPYNVLSREVESNRSMYVAVINRLQETTISSGAEKNPFRIVEEPMVPRFPSKPQKGKTMGMALLLGLGLGIAIVLFWDLLDSSIRSVDEAEESLGLSALAAIPEERTKSPFVFVDTPSSQQAEAFRTLRVALSLLGETENRRILLFTSAVPAEGKSFASANIAMALAQQGLRTLLVDADLRRPRLSSMFSEKSMAESTKEKAIGLTNCLSELNPWDECVQATGVTNLSLLPAGHRAPNPAELLGSKKFHDLIEEVSAAYDRVVIDTAPVNAVSDTLLLVRHVHAVCLVIRAHKTPAKAVQRAVHLLRKSGARMAGFILNRLPSGLGAGYYYYYYGDEYTKDSVYGQSASK